MVSASVTSNYRNYSRKHKISGEVTCICCYPAPNQCVSAPVQLTQVASHSFTFCVLDVSKIALMLFINKMFCCVYGTHYYTKL
jgi:hypothetical protein